MPAMAELLLKRATAASGEVYDVLSGSRIVGRILAIRCIAGITVGLDSILPLPRPGAGRDPGSLRVGLSVARTRSSRSELPLRQPIPSTMSPKTGSLCLWISNR